MIIHLFLKLSKVKIFPKAAVHEKKATLEGTFDRHTSFQGKDVPIVKEREKVVTMHFKSPALENFNSETNQDHFNTKCQVKHK